MLQYKTDDHNNVIITYDEYDHMVRICETIQKDADEQQKRNRFLFMTKSSFPTVAQMIENHVEDNFAHFFPFLLFYYEIPQDGLEDNEEYKESIKYLRSLFKDHVIFVENEEEEEA